MSSEEETKLNIDKLSNSQTLSEKEFERKTYWKSCCLKTDKRAVSFFTQFFISILIIIFCLYQLHILDKCDSDIYMNLLTLILGTWLPQPTIN
jgi:hypothetical protein